MGHILPFLIHWAITAFSLWLASRIFKGLKFTSGTSLAIAALLLGFANAIVKPLLILLTLPLTLITFGLFLMELNALELMLVAALVKGFRISGFWTALFSSLFISIVSTIGGAIVSKDDPGQEIQMPAQGSGIWL